MKCRKRKGMTHRAGEIEITLAMIIFENITIVKIYTGDSARKKSKVKADRLKKHISDW